jgi:hypothetical protein
MVQTPGGDIILSSLPSRVLWKAASTAGHASTVKTSQDRASHAIQPVYKLPAVNAGMLDLVLRVLKSGADGA